MIWPNTLCLLQQDLAQQPESSALDNAEDFGQWHCLKKIYCLKLPNSVRNKKKLEAWMALAMLPIKSLQHCQDQMIRAIIVHSLTCYNAALHYQV